VVLGGPLAIQQFLSPAMLPDMRTPMAV